METPTAEQLLRREAVRRHLCGENRSVVCHDLDRSPGQSQPLSNGGSQSVSPPIHSVHRPRLRPSGTWTADNPPIARAGTCLDAHGGQRSATAFSRRGRESSPFGFPQTVCYTEKRTARHYPQPHSSAVRFRGEAERVSFPFGYLFC